MRHSTNFAAIVGVIALVGCTATGNMPYAPTEPSEAAVEALPPYRLQVGDILDLRLMLNPELNEEVTVRPDGHIATTVVSDELAAGRTIPELTEALRRDYGRDLRNPRVSLLLKSFAPARIYVGGEVVTPGEFVTVGPNLTLAQALARAGGVRITADDTSIFIIRRTAGKPVFYRTRYSDVIHGRDADADVRLAPYDIVYVPKTGIAEVYAVYNQYLEQFVHPSVGFFYGLGGGGGGGGNTVISTPSTAAPAVAR